MPPPRSIGTLKLRIADVEQLDVACIDAFYAYSGEKIDDYSTNLNQVLGSTGWVPYQPIDIIILARKVDSDLCPPPYEAQALIDVQSCSFSSTLALNLASTSMAEDNCSNSRDSETVVNLNDDPDSLIPDPILRQQVIPEEPMESHAFPEKLACDVSPSMVDGNALSFNHVPRLRKSARRSEFYNQSLLQLTFQQ